MPEKRRRQTVMRRGKRRRKGRKGTIRSLIVLPLVLISSWLPALIFLVPPFFRESEYQLDDDDYELLQEASGYQRPKLVSLLPFICIMLYSIRIFAYLFGEFVVDVACRRRAKSSSG